MQKMKISFWSQYRYQFTRYNNIKIFVILRLNYQHAINSIFLIPAPLTALLLCGIQYFYQANQHGQGLGFSNLILLFLLLTIAENLIKQIWDAQWLLRREIVAVSW